MWFVAALLSIIMIFTEKFPPDVFFAARAFSTFLTILQWNISSGFKYVEKKLEGFSKQRIIQVKIFGCVHFCKSTEMARPWEGANIKSRACRARNVSVRTSNSYKISWNCRINRVKLWFRSIICISTALWVDEPSLYHFKARKNATKPLLIVLDV